VPVAVTNESVLELPALVKAASHDDAPSLCSALSEPPSVVQLKAFRKTHCCPAESPVELKFARISQTMLPLGFHWPGTTEKPVNSACAVPLSAANSEAEARAIERGIMVRVPEGCDR